MDRDGRDSRDMGTLLQDALQLLPPVLLTYDTPLTCFRHQDFAITFNKRACVELCPQTADCAHGEILLSASQDWIHSNGEPPFVSVVCL